MIDMASHPCFNPEAKGKFGRVHLPVAPKCNVQCLFCNRKYDCVNESRPGVTSSLLSPGQALHYVTRLLDMGKPISVAGIAGPGDPFANPHETMETMRLLRRKLPNLLLCVSTNGLAVGPYIPELATIGVSHVTVTISALDPEIGEQIYGWVRDDKKIYRGRAGASLMIFRQVAAVRALKAHGITVKVNSILIPGVNEHHMEQIAQFCKTEGVDMHNVIPLCPVEDTPFEDLREPTAAEVHAIRESCGKYVTQMTHCQRCRADACGLLTEGTTQETMNMLQEASKEPIFPDQERPNVAVATREHLLVNLHLGEAREFVIYAPTTDGSGFREIDVRKAPEPGCKDDRWKTLGSVLSDCRAVLVSSAGPRPTSMLEESGIRVIVMEGLIDEALTTIYSGKEVKAPVREFKCGKGASCGGDGAGCG
jgi:nitrogen fixation protein NifB